MLLDWLQALRHGNPAISVHLLAGEKGPVIEACAAASIPCEVLPFPSALRAFGSDHRRASARSILRPARRLLAWAGAGWACLRYKRVLRRRLMQLRPDVIHSNGAQHVRRLCGP